MSRDPIVLATFQPIEPTKRKRSYRAFEETLGYYPVFCFAARTVEEFQFNCWASTPGMPEKIILFESCDYAAYDAVEWCRLFANDSESAEKLSGSDIAHIFEGVRSPYAEFAVPGIPEEAVIDEIGLVDLIDNILPGVDDEAMRMVAETAQQHFDALMRYAKTSRHPKDEEQRRSLAYAAKTVFETLLSGITYRASLGQGTPIEKIFPFAKAGVHEDDPDDVRYLIPAAELRKKIYDSEIGGTHGEFDKMLELMTRYQEKMLAETTSSFLKAGRNDPCPCGSGKKFKKCHGSPAALTLRLYEPFYQEGI